ASAAAEARRARRVSMPAYRRPRAWTQVRVFRFAAAVAPLHVYDSTSSYTSTQGRAMRTNIDIDDTLMAEAQKASGHATKKQTVEEALRLMIKLRQQREAAAAFGKYRWRGNLARSRKGRGTG